MLVYATVCIAFDTVAHWSPVTLNNASDYRTVSHCCCCDSPATHLLSSAVQVEEVCNRGRVVPLRVALDGFDSWTDVLWSVVWQTSDILLVMRAWWCGPCNCSRADSDQNATGQVWYGLTEAADFEVVRYQVDCQANGLWSVLGLRVRYSPMHY